jgi:hypothetical protein
MLVRRILESFIGLVIALNGLYGIQPIPNLISCIIFSRHCFPVSGLSVSNSTPDVPDEGERRLLHKTPSQEVTVDENGHRRLAYTTICGQLYTYVAATHDDLWYNRWDDHTTYYAFVGPYGAM